MSHPLAPIPQLTPPKTDDPVARARYRLIRDNTLIGATINVALSIGKIAVGYIGQSQALIADGLHSLSDLVSDIIVLFAAKHGSKDADEDHPYGHGRIETFFTIIIGIFLIAVACGMIVDTVWRLTSPDKLLQPNLWTLITAAIGIGVKEWLYHYTKRVADQVQSALIHANAWHHRSDAISSIIVMIGIGGSMMGVVYLDALAALGMAVMIIKIGWDICLQSFKELIDTALDPSRVRLIVDTIREIPGVRAVHTLRTRKMGHDALVDVHIQVAPKLSVSEGHYISDRVRHTLLETVDEVADVTVHIDPEDDETGPINVGLPHRQAILDTYKKYWQDIPEAAAIEKIDLHYLDGKIHMEVLLPLGKLRDIEHARDVASRMVNNTALQDQVSDIKVLFH